MHTPATSVEGDYWAKAHCVSSEGVSQQRPSMTAAREQGSWSGRPPFSVCRETLQYLSFIVWNMAILRVCLTEWCEDKLIRQDRLRCCIQQACFPTKDSKTSPRCLSARVSVTAKTMAAHTREGPQAPALGLLRASQVRPCADSRQPVQSAHCKYTSQGRETALSCDLLGTDIRAL